MKPIRLEIAAFGPFAGLECIDFTEIAGRSLLLIHGPTGSGKTTVLDAMCFALFGETSGVERTAKEMRCDSAEPTQSTYVTYDFSLGERSFRVTRYPDQVRAKKKGGVGMASVAHKATLWERRSETTNNWEETLLATGATKVSQAVSELFGFESKQFRQVVVLPQGKFRQLLTASSRDREKILEQLFDTHLYGEIERSLLERAGELKRLLGEKGGSMRTLLAHVEVQSLAELATKIALAEDEHTSAEKCVPARKTLHGKADEALIKGKRDQEKLREAEVAKTTLAGLEQDLPKMDALREQCRLGQLARPLVEMEPHVKERQLDATNAMEQQEVSTLQLKSAEVDAHQAILNRDAQIKRTLEREQLAEELTGLRLMVEGVGRFHRTTSEYHETINKEKKSLVRCEQIERKLHDDKAILEALQIDLTRVNEEGAKKEGLVLARDNARTVRERRRSLDRVRSERTNAEEQLQLVSKECEEADALLTTQVNLLSELEATWRSGQAGALARILVEGYPCPVCGSSEHPDSAKYSKDLPREDEMQSTRSTIDLARDIAKKWHTKSVSAGLMVDHRQSELHVIEEQLGLLAKQSLGEIEKELVSAEVALANSVMAIESRALIVEKLRTTQERACGGEESLQLAQVALTESRQMKARSAGAMDEITATIPEKFRVVGALDVVLDSKTSLLQTMQHEYVRSQNKAQEAAQFLASTKEKVQNGNQRVMRAKKAADAAQTRFTERREELGFSSEKSYLMSRRSLATLTEDESQVGQYDVDRKVATMRHARCLEAIGDVVPPQMEALERNAQRAAEAHQLAIQREVETRKEHEALSSLQNEYLKIQRNVIDIESEWQVVASVSELANGKIPPQNLSFKRFVLGAYLDEVLLAATERLMRMSKRRYSLSRRDEARNRARSGGLELEVVDAYTGTSRSVATLSGGESFLAALSLSLGLADVVQSYSGGRRLDTLFVDEGFGSLDSNALDLALDTLTELNAEGRLVGIISHVEELKNRIGTRLEVKASPDGSTTKFSL